MSKVILLTLLSTSLVFAAVLTGCSQQQSADEASPSPEPASSNSAMTGHEGHDHQGQDHEGHMHDQPGDSESKESFADLSPELRELAKKQEICPVSGQPLGSMGTPYKVTVQGRDVLLCCSGCESQIKENPEEYLAKLEE